MARLTRVNLAGIGWGIVRRRNDRQPCSGCEADELRYGQTLGGAAFKRGGAVHAYVSTTSHVHLLVTSAEPGAMSRMMRAIGRLYVGCSNQPCRRTGTLWEGHFKSGSSGDHQYLLAC